MKSPSDIITSKKTKRDFKCRMFSPFGLGIRPDLYLGRSKVNECAEKHPVFQVVVSLEVGVIIGIRVI